MKKLISLALAAVLILGNVSMCFGADTSIRYSYRTKNLIEYDTINTVSSIRVKLTVPNYIGSLDVELQTSEGSGMQKVHVVYLPDNKWDNGSYYGAVSGVINSGANKVYSYNGDLVLWKDLYSYGFLAHPGGQYTADYNSLQMHFLNGPGLYTALASIYYSTSDLGLNTVAEMQSKAPGSLKLTGAGYPFILALNDTTIKYFYEHGTLNSYSKFDWPGLKDLLEDSRYEIESVAAEQALKNFKARKNYYNGVFLDVGIGKTAWYDDNVKTVYRLGLMEGNDGYFDPNGNITLAQAIAMACRLHNIYNGGNGAFSEGPIWFSVYVNYAKKNGIIKNTDFNAVTKGNSAYSRYATRAEMAYIFCNAMPADALPKINRVTNIPDVYTSTKYMTSIYDLYQAGVCEGDAKHRFYPNNNITRAEAAAIISRMADTSLRSRFTLR
ncbi:MAG: S-layer homology domain-containing protein [Firmicutes bacterium]|nr:S-layer homology domain-containing protein [Bacillota bacterium]